MIRDCDLDFRIESTQIKLRLLQLKTALLQEHIHLKDFNPNQPRNPAGQPEGGRWVGRDDERVEDPQKRPRENIRFVSLRKNTQEYCDEQYNRDVFHCRMVGLRSCYAQAMVRLVACEQGNSIPPLNY